MAADAWKAFNTARLWALDPTGILVATNAMTLAIFTSSLTPNAATQSIWSDISANEVANGNGYTTGGVALTGVSLTQSTVTVTYTYTGPTPKWTATGTGIPAHRYAVLYVNATVNSHVKPLLAWSLLDNTPTDVPLTPSGTTLDYQAHASGVLTLTGM